MKRYFLMMSLVFLLTPGCGEAESTSDLESLTSQFSTAEYEEALAKADVHLQSLGPDEVTDRSAGPHMSMLWAFLLRKYNTAEQNFTWSTTCRSDVSKIVTAFYHHFTEWGRQGLPANISPKGFFPEDDGSSVRHFFAGASWQATWGVGRLAQSFNEWRQNGYTADYTVDNFRDDAYGFLGADFADAMTVSEFGCRTWIEAFVAEDLALQDIFVDARPLPNAIMTEQLTQEQMNELREQWSAQSRKYMNAALSR